MKVTYEASHNEPVHPDPDVRHRLIEVSLSSCPYGCKIYADPRSNMKVLAHSATYGCRR